MIRKLLAVSLVLLITSVCISAEESQREPLRIAYAEYMPFFFEGSDGKPRGIFVDIWDLWSRKTGVPVSFLTLPWAETLTQLRDGKVDINAGVFYTTERDTYLDFSQPFFDLATHLFYRTTGCCTLNLRKIELRCFSVYDILPVA